MKNHKTAVSLALIGLFVANVAFALPGFTREAPQSSVDTCVAEVDAKADYDLGQSVIHNVVTEERRVSGHKMNIRTIVYGEGDTVIREYATYCAIDDQDDIRRFKIRQKGV